MENLIHIVLNTVEAHNHRCYAQLDENALSRVLAASAESRRPMMSSGTRSDLLGASLQADQISNLGLKDSMGSRDTRMSGSKLDDLDLA